MGLLVNARRLSAPGREGLLFTAVSVIVHEGDLAVITGPPGPGRTALLLALAGRFITTGGSLSTDSSYPLQGPRALRKRIAVAQAPPAIALDSGMRVREALVERRLHGGRRNVTAEAVWDACELMGIGQPPLGDVIATLHPVERLLFTVALAVGDKTIDGVAVADADADLGQEDREFVRRAFRRLTDTGIAVIATSADTGWGDVEVALEPSSPQAGDNEDDEDRHTPRKAPSRPRLNGDEDLEDQPCEEAALSLDKHPAPHTTEPRPQQSKDEDENPEEQPSERGGRPPGACRLEPREGDSAS